MAADESLLTSLGHELQRALPLPRHGYSCLQLGLILILNFKYFHPLVARADIHSATYSLILLALFKLVATGLLNRESAPKRKLPASHSISISELYSSAGIKCAAYVSLIMLLVHSLRATFSATCLCFVLFVGVLNCFQKSEMVRRLWRGRKLTDNQITAFLVYGIVVVAVALQPSKYETSFPLLF